MFKKDYELPLVVDEDQLGDSFQAANTCRSLE